MGHSRARRLTTRLSRVTSECRADIARRRNERARAAREAGREERLALALLVAEHVWEDTAFVAAATEVAEAPAGVRAWWRRGNMAGKEGDKSGSGIGMHSGSGSGSC